MVKKSPDAFRTISEVADIIEVPAHVLRFWESKFTQIKPIKRGGGRRYYRPADIDLIQGIRTLLYDQGLTIKGAQKVLRDKGVRHVMKLGTGELDAAPAPVPEPPMRPPATPRHAVRKPKKTETGVQFAFDGFEDVPASASPTPDDAASEEPDAADIAMPAAAAEQSPEETIRLAEIRNIVARLQAIRARIVAG